MVVFFCVYLNLYLLQKNDETFEVIQSNDKKTDCGGEKEAQVEDEDDDDDDDEELTDFVPFSWHSDAIPQRSALKNKDRLRVSACANCGLTELWRTYIGLWFILLSSSF